MQQEDISVQDTLAGYPEYSKATLEELATINAHIIAEASALIRSRIKSGDLAQMSPENLFKYIHRAHIGSNAVSNAIALYDTSLARKDQSGEAGYYKSLLTSVLSNQSAYEQDGIRTTGLQFGHIRKAEHTNTLWIIGFPPKEFMEGILLNNKVFLEQKLAQPIASQIFDGDSISSSQRRKIEVYSLEAISKLFWDKVNQVLHRKDSMTDIEKYKFSIVAATILDFLHLKPDGNGRTSEDWMIEIQMRLFDRDTSKILSWSPNNLRGADIPSALFKPETTGLSKYRKREEILRERGKRIKQFREYILAKLEGGYSQSALGDSVYGEGGMNDLFLASDPKLYFEVIEVVIRGMDIGSVQDDTGLSKLYEILIDNNCKIDFDSSRSIDDLLKTEYTSDSLVAKTADLPKLGNSHL